jgi:hypothetical protein
MTELTTRIGELLPNLDAMDIDDMPVMRQELIVLSVGIRALASYAEAKQEAMVYRLAGNIDLAQRIETHCESLYHKLPDWAKW